MTELEFGSNFYWRRDQNMLAKVSCVIYPYAENEIHNTAQLFETWSQQATHPKLICDGYVHSLCNAVMGHTANF